MGTLGLIGSVLLHLVVVSAALYGSPARKVAAPNQLGAGASAQLSGGSPAMTLVFLDQSVAPESATELMQDLSSEGLKPEEMLADVASPESLPPSSLVAVQDGEMDVPTLEAQGDMATRAALYGRYMGQISARTRRAWNRPRTPLNDRHFTCQVLIRQSPSGTVETVELVSCNGDLRWQLSLVQGIQAASPLPAPPDPAVFVSAVTLEFESEPYVAGGDEQGFEPTGVAIAAAAMPLAP